MINLQQILQKFQGMGDSLSSAKPFFNNYSEQRGRGYAFPLRKMFSI